MADDKKYNHMENVFQYINKHYVSLDKDQIKSNNRIIGELHMLLTNEMKEANELFKKMYTTIYYGGSYYDGLKISDPGEYDCDLLLRLPAYAKPMVQISSPGFVQVQLTDWEKFSKQPEFKAYYADMEKCLLDDDKYLRVDKLKRWVESILDKVFNKFPKVGNFYSFTVDDKPYYFKKTKGGPAFTVHITDSTTSEKFFMDMDLVPCFEFEDDNWPSDDHFRKNSTKVSTFFVVPKKPKGSRSTDKDWRLSFQKQEGEILGQRQSLKPALKLLKKLRDNFKHTSISSYFIKTIFVWEVDKGDETLWNNNLSTVFMKMLKTYYDHLDNRNIPYFWDKRFNLIGDVKAIELENIRNKIGKILGDIERNINDPFVMATYLVPKEDLEQLKEKVNLGKKYEKRSTDVNGYFQSISLTNTSDTDSSPISSASSYNNVSSDTNNNDKMTSVEHYMKEMNSKIDLILKEQQKIRELLERIDDKQADFEDRLRELKPHREQSRLDIEGLLSSPYDGVNSALRCMRLENNM